MDLDTPDKYSILNKYREQYRSAHRIFLWWVSGFVYCCFCLWGNLLAPLVETGIYELAFLNRRGASILGLIALIGSFDAWFKRRREKLAWQEMLSVT